MRGLIRTSPRRSRNGWRRSLRNFSYCAGFQASPLTMRSISEPCPGRRHEFAVARPIENPAEGLTDRSATGHTAALGEAVLQLGGGFGVRAERLVRRLE